VPAEITDLVMLLFKIHRTSIAGNELFKMGAFCLVRSVNQEMVQHREEGREYNQKLQQDKSEN
jgi:hypothetical protein